MLRPKRAIFVFVLVSLIAATVVSKSSEIRTASFTVLETPLNWTQTVTGFFQELWFFRRNAIENRKLRHELAVQEWKKNRYQEIVAENQRLLRLLDLRSSAQAGMARAVSARVLVMSPVSLRRFFVIDKGSSHGIKPSRLVLSGHSLAGVVVDVRPTSATVRQITDSLFRVGVMIQRSRHQGMLFGTLQGECRIKYLPVDADVKPGDLVETAGFGGFYPKAIPVGIIKRVWKEPGQIYLVAEVTPFTDYNRMEEVLILD